MTDRTQTPAGKLLGKLLMLGPLGELVPAQILPVLEEAIRAATREGVEATIRECQLTEGSVGPLLSAELDDIRDRLLARIG